jgi:hypothetical protein
MGGKRWKGRSLATVLCAACSLGSVGSASAAETHPFLDSFGSFQNPQSLALDQSSGDVYVLDAGAATVSRFDSDGNPIAFSATAPYISGNVLSGSSDGNFRVAPGGSESQIAVAPPGSLGGTAGNLYVTEVDETGGGSIAVFAASGEFLGRIDGSGNPNPTAGGQPCGVAVGPDGAVYVGYFSGHVDKYVPSANPPLNSDFDSSIVNLGGICNVAASSTLLFVSTWPGGPLTAYPLSLFPGGDGEADASGSGIVVEAGGTPVTSTTAAVDPSNDDLYVDEESQVAQFDATGSLVGRSGAAQLTFSHGVAIDATGGATDNFLYAANGEPGEVLVFGPAALLPDVATGEATEVTANTATLQGTVNAAGGPAATCVFEYVDDASFQAGGFAGAATAPCDPAGPFTGSADNAVSASLTGLTAETTYHFRLAASNENGSNPGTAQTFTTPPAVLLLTGTATDVTGESATLRGEILPLGDAVQSCSFEYGKTEAYGQTVPCAESPAEIGTGSEPKAVHADIAGLELATGYHFRLVASNAKGTTRGQDSVFATLGPRASVTAVSEISDTSARFDGVVNPGGEPTTYAFEYVTEANFQESGFAEATSLPLGGGPVGSGGSDVAVSQQPGNLLPGTTYRVRLLATNPSGIALGLDRTFTTFGGEGGGGGGLPDGRAYELVSPTDTNGTFLGTLTGERSNFSTPLATPNGESVIFYSQGTLPGMEGNGTTDSYQAVRGAEGWTTRSTSPLGSQAVAPSPGGTSADHQFSFWSSGRNGGSLDPGDSADYLRKPDGSFELIARGSLGEAVRAQGRWIAPGATHVIFNTEAGNSVQLEPQAPPAGIEAIYDRSPGGPTHVVSLLPGDLTPSANATYLGNSEDGSAVVFAVEGTIYERRDNATTLEVASGGATYAGVSRDGGRVFYLQGGDAFAFDAVTESTTPIGSGGETTIVRVSAGGSHVYFSSGQQLDGSNGDAGARNLYVWDGASVRFIAVLDPADFDDGASLVNLGRWTDAIGPTQNGLVGPALVPARTTPDGTVFVFQSHGVSGQPFDSEGHWEIYRYDTGSEGIACLSCSPLGAGTDSDAELQSIAGLTVVNAPTNATSRIDNLTADGETVFFQSREPLVLHDTDGLNDVYRWKGGQVALISSGRSANPDYLTGMSASGRDVFFKTSDRLVPEDETGGSGSFYDARVGGGFPPAVASPPCTEATCQGPGTMPPPLPSAGSAEFQGPGNRKPRRHRARKRCKAKQGKGGQQQRQAKRCKKRKGKR